MLLGDRKFFVSPGDCILHMAEMPPASIDLAVFSPPFPALYAYTSDEADLGNAEDPAEMKLHFGFFCRQLARVMKPGRVVVMHCMKLPRMKRSGGRGLFDFPAFLARLAERSGLVFEYDWCVRKNPQAQAITTKSRELQFAGLEADRARSRGALPDYLLKFTAPGENAVPIDDPGSVSRNQWIDYAEHEWEAVRYPVDHAGTTAYTLNVAAARGPDDTRHICPLQLSIVDRVVRMFSRPGEVVFSPFAGIGSEGYVAVRLGRRFYGVELKDEYRRAAIENIRRAAAPPPTGQRTLFDDIPEEAESCPTLS